MTRAEAINLLTARLADLSDERVETLAELADAYLRPTFFSTMTADQKAELAQSIAEADRGEGAAAATVFDRVGRRHGFVRGE
jgi:hypothetical protein